MWVRGDLDPADATFARDRDQVLHQRTPGALPHPLRIDEQILKLDHIPDAEPGGEADDAAVGHSTWAIAPDKGVNARS
jgi:hypothetical protein